MRKNIFFIFCIIVGVCLTFAGTAMGAEKHMTVNLFGWYTRVSASHFGWYIGMPTVGHTGKNKPPAENGDNVMASYTDYRMEAFDQIDIDLLDMRVTLQAADFYGIEIYSDVEKVIRWSNENGVLTITDETNMGLSFAMDMVRNGYVNVYYPAGLMEKVDITTVSGSVVVSDCETNSLTVSTTSGRIELTNCTGDALNVGTTSGRIMVKDSQQKYNQRLNSVSGRVEVWGGGLGDLDIETTSGAVMVSDSQYDAIRVNTVSGRTELSDCISETLNAGSTSGQLVLTNSLHANTWLNTISGKITCGIAGPAEEFTLELKTMSGSVNVNGAQVSKEYEYYSEISQRTITAETLNGRIDLTFEN